MRECGQKIGEASEGTKGGSRVRSQALGEEKGEVVEGWRIELREPIFEIAPQALDGIQLRRIRGKKQQRDIRGQAERLGFVKSAIVEQEEMEAGEIDGGEVVEEELEALGVEGRQLQKEALPRERFDGPVQVQTLEVIGRRHEGLDAACRDAPTEDGQEAAPTFVLRPHTPVGVSLLLSSSDVG